MIHNVGDTTLLKGYKYILENPCGYLIELDNIDENLADYFATAGIIAFGINSHAEMRYKLTAEGERIAKLEIISLNWKLNFRDSFYKNKITPISRF